MDSIFSIFTGAVPTLKVVGSTTTNGDGFIREGDTLVKTATMSYTWNIGIASVTRGQFMNGGDVDTAICIPAVLVIPNTCIYPDNVIIRVTFHTNKLELYASSVYSSDKLSSTSVTLWAFRY